MQLINCINVRLNYFKDEEADIVIDKKERVSDRLIEVIDESKVFGNVFAIEMPDFFEPDKKGWANFASHMRYKKYFANQLKLSIHKKKYETFILSAFWGETLNVYRYLKKVNPKVGIEIVEEGMANYDGPRSWIYRTAPASYLKSVIRGIFYCHNMGVAIRRRVRCIYLYSPELSWTHRKSIIYKLPAINGENPVLYNIFKKWQGRTNNDFYMRCRYIFIIDAPMFNENLYEVFRNVLQEMSGQMRDFSIIRLHPLSKIDKKVADIYNEDGIWVDNRKVPIENTLFQCDIEKKVLIVNRSSVLLYLRCMLNKEPWVILTYKIPAFCGRESIVRFDYFVKKLQDIYTNPDKIIIPNTVDEFKDTLAKLKPE